MSDPQLRKNMNLKKPYFKLVADGTNPGTISSGNPGHLSPGKEALGVLAIEVERI